MGYRLLLLITFTVSSRLQLNSTYTYAHTYTRTLARTYTFNLHLALFCFIQSTRANTRGACAVFHHGHLTRKPNLYTSSYTFVYRMCLLSLSAARWHQRAPVVPGFWPRQHAAANLICRPCSTSLL